MYLEPAARSTDAGKLCNESFADKLTTNVEFCNFILDSTLRVQSSMAQQIT